MNHWKKSAFVSLCLVLAFGWGCGKKRPDGIPDLYPASVIVKNGGSPIEKVSIVLIKTNSSSSEGSWSANGMTDSSGVAKIKTSQGDWVGNGVPAGEYTVFMNKRPDFTSEPIPPELEGDEAGKLKLEAEQKKKLEALTNEIPASLNSPVTSKLKLTVASGGPSELTVDVSEHK